MLFLAWYSQWGSTIMLPWVHTITSQCPSQRQRTSSQVIVTSFRCYNHIKVQQPTTINKAISNATSTIAVKSRYGTQLVLHLYSPLQTANTRAAFRVCLRVNPKRAVWSGFFLSIYVQHVLQSWPRGVTVFGVGGKNKLSRLQDGCQFQPIRAVLSIQLQLAACYEGGTIFEPSRC